MTRRPSEQLAEFLGPQEAPCLSLYQPTHRRHPGNQQDPIRYKNLLRTLDESLRRKYAQDADALQAPFRSLLDDHAFWNHALEGLAILGNRSRFRVFVLQRPVPERAIVAGSFHLGPLLRVLQSADRYQVLALNQHEVRLYEGDRDALAEMELAAGVPRTLTDALGEEVTDPRLTVASYGTGPGGPGRAEAGPGMYHGHGGKKDEVDVDRERFFRAVDRAVLEHHSRPSGLPLILAALPEHHSVFHAVSKNPALFDGGITADADALGPEQLREQAWRVVAPRFQARIDSLLEAFGVARARAMASADRSDVAAAAAQGRVQTLLVEAERRLPGRVDASSGNIVQDEAGDPEVDDVLDDIAELVLAKGGEVLYVAAACLPDDSGLAAIYRF